MFGIKKIHNDEFCASCYFRSLAIPPQKKAFIQLTEKCNMKCKHCFVSASTKGEELSYETLRTTILPHLLKNNVSKVTLTGGEPFVHNELLSIIELLVSNNLAISICTNASLISEQFLDDVSKCSSIHFNVSLDGFSFQSHGKFRGMKDINIFNKTLYNISMLGNRGVLNGILVTPNVYSNIHEYEKICEFAKKIHAKYVLFNPLSKFGRGVNSTNFAFANEEMNKLRDATQKFHSDDFDVVYIRFPNEGKPLEECFAGQIFYIFSNGDVTICPYMVFAAKNKISKYNPVAFIIGNVYDQNFNLQEELRNYTLPQDQGHCSQCDFSSCKKGCIAAKIAIGLTVNDADVDLCPYKKKSDWS